MILRLGDTCRNCVFRLYIEPLGSVTINLADLWWGCSRANLWRKLDLPSCRKTMFFWKCRSICKYVSCRPCLFDVWWSFWRDVLEGSTVGEFFLPVLKNWYNFYTYISFCSVRRSRGSVSFMLCFVIFTCVFNCCWDLRCSILTFCDHLLSMEGTLFC